MCGGGRTGGALDVVGVVADSLELVQRVVAELAAREQESRLEHTQRRARRQRVEVLERQLRHHLRGWWWWLCRYVLCCLLLDYVVYLTKQVTDTAATETCIGCIGEGTLMGCGVYFSDSALTVSPIIDGALVHGLA